MPQEQTFTRFLLGGGDIFCRDGYGTAYEVVKLQHLVHISILHHRGDVGIELVVHEHGAEGGFVLGHAGGIDYERSAVRQYLLFKRQEIVREDVLLGEDAERSQLLPALNIERPWKTVGKNVEGDVESYHWQPCLLIDPR